MPKKSITDTQIGLQLCALSVHDGRYQANCNDLRLQFSEMALIRERLDVEIKWLLYLCKHTKLIAKPHPPKTVLLQLIEDFNLQAAIEIKQIEQQTNHDVKAIEYWLAKQLNNLQAARYQHLIPFIHFALTSWDVNNLATVRQIDNTRNQLLLAKIQKIESQLQTLIDIGKNTPMLALTHGQPASPTTIGKELANFAARISAHKQQIIKHRFSAKFSGATGNYNAHKVAAPEYNWPKLCKNFVVNELGFNYTAYSTQIEPYDNLAHYFNLLSALNTCLLDLCQDCWQYISMGYFSQKTAENEVGSSTMPHKVNPIDFENAEGNLGLANSMLNFYARKLPISRQQRDLSDSTVLRSFGSCHGHIFIALDALIRGLAKIKIEKNTIQKKLSEHPEVLAEAIQTILRLHGDDQAYQKLKKLSRGQALDQEKISAFINTLSIPTQTKNRLAALCPENYIGYANKLAQAFNQKNKPTKTTKVPKAPKK